VSHDWPSFTPLGAKTADRTSANPPERGDRDPGNGMPPMSSSSDTIERVFFHRPRHEAWNFAYPHENKNQILRQSRLWRHGAGRSPAVLDKTCRSTGIPAPDDQKQSGSRIIVGSVGRCRKNSCPVPYMIKFQRSTTDHRIT